MNIKSNVNRGLIVFFIASSLVSCKKFTDDPDIQGVVLDRWDSQPVEGVSVNVSAYLEFDLWGGPDLIETIETDENGGFRYKRTQHALYFSFYKDEYRDPLSYTHLSGHQLYKRYLNPKSTLVVTFEDVAPSNPEVASVTIEGDDTWLVTDPSLTGNNDAMVYPRQKEQQLSVTYNEDSEPAQFINVSWNKHDTTHVHIQY